MSYENPFTTVLQMVLLLYIFICWLLLAYPWKPKDKVILELLCMLVQVQGTTFDPEAILEPSLLLGQLV